MEGENRVQQVRTLGDLNHPIIHPFSFQENGWSFWINEGAGLLVCKYYNINTYIGNYFDMHTART